MDANGWSGYHGGVFTGCRSTSLNHAILLVGYGNDGQGYWKIKNSWGTSFGEGGYMRVTRNGNPCGILNQAVYAVVAGSPGPSPGPSPPSPPPSPSSGVEIKLWGTSKCLDLAGGNTANGNYLMIWDCNGHTNQKWVFANGAWHISSAMDQSKCIDVPGGNSQNGNSLQVWECNGHLNQKWGYDVNMKTIYLAWENHVKCIDVPNGDGKGIRNGNKVHIWDCNGHTNQMWYISSGPSPSPGPSPPPAPPPAPPSPSPGKSCKWTSDCPPGQKCFVKSSSSTGTCSSSPPWKIIV